MTIDSWKLIAGASAAIVSGGVAGYILSRQRGQQIAPPKKWVRVGTVSSLLMYPIKSCKGVLVSQSTVSTVGLKVTEYFRDRVFMVVDGRYVFQTQRTIPKMSQIQVTVNGNELELAAPGMEGMRVKIPDARSSGVTKKTCRIFDDQVAEVLDCGSEVGEWLSKFLEKEGLRLVYHALDKTQRTMTGLQKKFPYFVPTDKGAFQDQTSYMLMSETSIEDLNHHLGHKVTHRNFRPSILIKDVVEPFAEDFWNFVKIGVNGPVLKAAKPCTRCKLTTVNPDTGEFIQSGEPLSKLMKMPRPTGDDVTDKLIKGQGVLGLQLGLLEGNGKEIKVGDAVYAAVL